MQAAFELEFTLLKHENGRDTLTSYADMGPLMYSSAHVLDIAAEVFEDIINTLNEIGMTLEIVQAKNGKGQFHIMLQHQPVQGAV